ncbi:hypothetical protein BDD12DRAFT_863223 [Trichophaea hybrida]|nr:hypothetical protein BDD12DRAFT_863223 [Trichophaea hybrida]
MEIVGLQGLREKYSDAPRKLESMEQECTTLSATMTAIRWWIESTLAHFPELQEEIKPLEATLEACLKKIEGLNAEVEKVVGKSEQRTWMRRTKFKYIWNDDIMKEHLDELRWLSQALNNLLIATSLPILESKRQVREVVRAASVHYSLPTYARDLTDRSSATIWSDAEFAFDDIVVNSAAYRRVFREALRSTSSPGPQMLSGSANNLSADEAIRAALYQRLNAFGTETMWQKPTFEWEEWVRNHITSKKWNPEWVPADFATAGVAAKAMYDKLAGAIDQDDDAGLGCPSEIAINLSLLTLYDLVLLIDDSSSMTFKEKVDPNDQSDNPATCTRQNTLLQVLELVCKIYECARPDGIVSLGFFNARKVWKDVTEEKLNSKRNDYKCQGVTRIGNELKRKVIDSFVFQKDVDKKMSKPLLVVVITDGRIEGEQNGLLENVIINCILECSKDPDRGAHAVAFQFAQVGRDKDAALLLRKLSADNRLNGYIDCVLNTSLDFILDDDRKWGIMAQLLLGAITETWSSRNAPLLWEDEPSRADLARFNAIDNTTTSEEKEQPNSSANPPIEFT